MEKPGGEETWVAKTGREAVRPRVIFSDRMVVFGAAGIRHDLFPDRHSIDGFDNINHHVYVAGPEDLKPENHAKLKSILLDKYAKAEALPMSQWEKKEIQNGFLYHIGVELARRYPIPLIRHFAERDPEIRARYLKRSTMDEIRGDTFNHYDLLRDAKANLDMDDEKFYRHLRDFFTRHGKKDVFETVERESAEFILRHKLRDLPIDDEEKRRIVRDCIKIRQEGGRQHISINPKPLEALHRRLVQETVAQLDAHIQEAHDFMVGSALWEGFDPFAHKLDEQAKIEEIHTIAHRESRAKPVVLAGYANPDLTIILEKTPLSGHEGLSYGGQDLIRINFKCKQNPFDGTLREELLHQGMDKIYNNISLPYGKEGDNRKALLERAVAADNKDERVFGYLGFMREAQYNTESTLKIHQEVPVKLLRSMDRPEWADIKRAADPEGHAYEQLERFVTEVTVKDAIAYLQGQPLPAVGDDYSRTPSHTGQAAQPREGWTKGLK